MDEIETTARLIPGWQLTSSRQIELGDEYGHYLDSLPPACSLDTKIERFGTDYKSEASNIQADMQQDLDR